MRARALPSGKAGETERSHSRPGAGATETVRLGLRGRGAERGSGPSRGPAHPVLWERCGRGGSGAGDRTRQLVGHLPGPSLARRRLRGRDCGPATSRRRRRGGAGGLSSAPRPAVSSATRGGSGVECEARRRRSLSGRRALGFGRRHPPNLNAFSEESFPPFILGLKPRKPALVCLILFGWCQYLAVPLPGLVNHLFSQEVDSRL